MKFLSANQRDQTIDTLVELSAVILGRRVTSIQTIDADKIVIELEADPRSPVSMVHVFGVKTPSGHEQAWLSSSTNPAGAIARTQVRHVNEATLRLDGYDATGRFAVALAIVTHENLDRRFPIVVIDPR